MSKLTTSATSNTLTYSDTLWGWAWYCVNRFVKINDILNLFRKEK